MTSTATTAVSQRVTCTPRRTSVSRPKASASIAQMRAPRSASRTVKVSGSRVKRGYLYQGVDSARERRYRANQQVG